MKKNTHLIEAVAVRASLFVVHHNQLRGGAARAKGRGASTGRLLVVRRVAVVVAFLAFGGAHEGARLEESYTSHAKKLNGMQLRYDAIKHECRSRAIIA